MHEPDDRATAQQQQLHLVPQLLPRIMAELRGRKMAKPDAEAAYPHDLAAEIGTLFTSGKLCCCCCCCCARLPVFSFEPPVQATTPT